MRVMQAQGFLYENIEHRLMVAIKANEAVGLLEYF
jgi:hypothetical protein